MNNLKYNAGCVPCDRIGDFKPYDNKGNKYFETIFKDREDEFLEMLNEDAKIECGKNKEGEFKLLFIEL